MSDPLKHFFNQLIYLKEICKEEEEEKDSVEEDSTYTEGDSTETEEEPSAKKGTTNRPYNCSLCGKGFRYPCDTKKHEKTHAMHECHRRVELWRGRLYY